MAIGMSYDEFWNGEPELAAIYREAHVIRNEIKNQELWLQGLYNYRAFASVVESLALSFAGGKGSKASRYPEQPIPLTEKELEDRKRQSIEKTLSWVKSGQQ